MSAGSNGGNKPFVADTNIVARPVMGLVQGPYRSPQDKSGGGGDWVTSLGHLIYCALAPGGAVRL